MKPYSILRSIFLWLIPTLFFTYQFMIRNTHGLLVDELTTQFNINAIQFALFSSLFYASYSLLQIPVGILLDKYNPKYILSSVMAVYAVGAWLFAYTDNFYLALIARIIMGFGSVIGFLGSAKLASLYFKEAQYSFLISITFTAGFLGAIYGGKPVVVLINSYPWQNVYFFFVGIGLLLAAIAFIFVNKPQIQEQVTDITFKDIIQYFRHNKTIIFVAICGGFMMGPTEGFADAWGVKYLMTIYNLSKEDASFAVSMVYLGLCFGGPLMVVISEKFNCDVLTVMGCGILMTICLLILIFVDNLSYQQIMLCCTLIGVGCGSQVIIFTINSKLIDKQYAAITAAITNSIVMSSGFFIHLIIGAVIEYIGTGQIIDNRRIFSSFELKAALSTIPFLMIIGSTLIIFAHKKLATQKA